MNTMGTESSGSALGGLIPLAILIFMIVSLWKVFSKAGEPGWVAIIPILNVYYLLKVAGKPGWWLILCFIPVLNLIPAILAPLGVSERFGKGVGFGIGLLFLPFIFYPILAFGSAQYGGGTEGASGNETAPSLSEG
jgi:hypothetical protein